MEENIDNINITFCSFPDFSNNAKVLYEFMSKKYKKHNYTWIVYNEESVKKLKSEGINAILIGSEDFKKNVKKTDIFFTTQGNLDRDKTKKSLYIELWHGIGPKPNGFLSKNPSKQDINGYGNMRNIIDYLIVPSDFWRVIFSAKFNIEYKRILPYGFPVLDTILKSNGKEILFKILNIDSKKYKKIIGYFPTFKKGFNHDDSKELNVNNIFPFDSYDEKSLDNYLKENNILLVLKRHPGDNTKYKIYESPNIIELNDKDLLKYNYCVHDIVNAFDVLITDYSSLGTEYLCLDRPIIFITNDYGEYKKNRGVIFDDLDFWTFGAKIESLKELKEEIYNLLNDKDMFKEKRKEKIKLFFPKIKTNNCENICNFLFDKNGNIKLDIIKTRDRLRKQLKIDYKITELESELKRITKEYKHSKEVVKRLEEEKIKDYEINKKTIERFEKEKLKDYEVNRKTVDNLEREIEYLKKHPIRILIKNILNSIKKRQKK